jgi:hypothetical protein
MAGVVEESAASGSTEATPTNMFALIEAPSGCVKLKHLFAAGSGACGGGSGR